MAVLSPYPFHALVARMFRELEESQSIFDLPERKFWLGSKNRDTSVRFQGRRASSPLGPAAGPQSQMAQNIVLSWLGGSRIMELKTVQIDDELDLPRPCIDMQTVGYNVEWSQELKLEESLEEYVKGAMLIDLLVASGKLDIAAADTDTLYDMSVGYDLAGIHTERVQTFLRGMLDCSELVERLRAQIPDEYAHLSDTKFRTQLSDTLTLSTFHGCPPDEIERIIEFLQDALNLHCIVKLNPMLLGEERTRELVNDVMGYDEIMVPTSAFERDTQWTEAVAFVQRLGDRADERGLSFGVKFTNTLIVENHREFFPGEKEMYLSGPPLHVLAINLVGQFRARFGDHYPISFSAGIDRKNFADACAIGLLPITVCSDLLKPGGYARSKGYFDELEARMDRVGAPDLESFIIRAYGLGIDALARATHDEDLRSACLIALADGSDLRAAAKECFERWVSETMLLNTTHYVTAVTEDERYHLSANTKVPKKIGSELELFDCITCDKCVPVCPNDANFTFVLPAIDVPVVKATRDANGAWSSREDGRLVIAEKHQIGNFADFCNDCGNCDVFCPEDGGPYVLKPRFFGSLEAWSAEGAGDGFFLTRSGDGVRVHGRFGKREFELDPSGAREHYRGAGFDVQFDPADASGSIEGTSDVEVDLAYAEIMRLVREGLTKDARENYVAGLLGAQ